MIKTVNKIIECKEDELDQFEKDFLNQGWNLLGTFKCNNGYKLDFAKDEYIEENKNKVKIYFDCGEVEEKILEESEINKLVSKESNYINYWKVEKLDNNKCEIIFEEKSPEGWKELGWSLAIKNIGLIKPVFNY